MEYYSVLKSNGATKLDTTCKKLKRLSLRERSQSEKATSVSLTTLYRRDRQNREDNEKISSC